MCAVLNYFVMCINLPIKLPWYPEESRGSSAPRRLSDDSQQLEQLGAARSRYQVTLEGWCRSGKVSCEQFGWWPACLCSEPIWVAPGQSLHGIPARTTKPLCCWPLTRTMPWPLGRNLISKVENMGIRGEKRVGLLADISILLWTLVN